MKAKSSSHVGEKFGKLTVLKIHTSSHGYHAVWECECECGAIKKIRADHVRDGTTVSCGCYSKSLRYKHGYSGKNRTKEYTCWAGMRARCSRKNHPNYKDYGGRGITVCQSWTTSFNNFSNDMGKAPTSAHTLGRMDNNGPYSPENCRWETRAQQAINRRSTIFITLNGVTKPMRHWCNELKIVSYQTACRRVKRGIPPEKAITYTGYLSHYRK